MRNSGQEERPNDTNWKQYVIIDHYISRYFKLYNNDK